MKENKKDEKKEIVVGGISTQTMYLTLEGETPLICHRFSDKAQDKILAKQMKTAKSQTGREAKNPEEDYKECLMS